MQHIGATVLVEHGDDMRARKGDLAKRAGGQPERCAIALVPAGERLGIEQAIFDALAARRLVERFPVGAVFAPV